MSAAIESLVEQFESRKLSRRQLVASLAALVASATRASAQSTCRGERLDAGAGPLAESRIARSD